MVKIMLDPFISWPHYFNGLPLLVILLPNQFQLAIQIFYLVLEDLDSVLTSPEVVLHLCFDTVLLGFHHLQLLHVFFEPADPCLQCLVLILQDLSRFYLVVIGNNYRVVLSIGHESLLTVVQPPQQVLVLILIELHLPCEGIAVLFVSYDLLILHDLFFSDLI